MKKSLLVFAFCCISILAKSQQGNLVSISPNTGLPGQNISTVITGNNTLFQNSSPQGNITNVYLQLGANTVTGDWFNMTVTDDTHCNVDFPIPGGTPIGIYDLNVTIFDQFTWNTYTLTLPAAFTIGNPDGYIQGHVFNDANQNGIQDGAETDVVGYAVTMTPGYSMNTDANGDYSFAVVNGTYTIAYAGYSSNQLIVVPGHPASYSVTINSNNSTGNDFPLVAGLDGFYPDSAYQGQNISVTVYSKGIFSTAGGANGNIGTARFSKGSTVINVPINKINVIDTNTAVVQFTVPSNAQLGYYNVFLYLNPAAFPGYHYLNNVFRVTTPPLYMTGVVFLDADSNGVQDPGEPGIPNEKVLLSPDSTYAISGSNGAYAVGTGPGTHTVSWVQQSPTLTLAPNNPASYTATVATTTGGFDFGLSSIYSPYTSIITNSPCWSGCAHPNYIGFTVENVGVVPFDGYAYFILDANMYYVANQSNPPADSVIGDTLFWNITNLMPFTPLIIRPAINTPIGGVTINYSATIVALNAQGTVAYVATDYGTHVVSCSMDPNEKSVTPEGVQAQHYTLMSDTLVYTIIFQNTGTDTAYTVVIRDTIDANLDLSTLHVIESSHTMNTEIPMLSRVVKFTFNNILLPDSNVNETQSHGFVRYWILPKTGLPNNTPVFNDADIYFDFNQPVITDQTFNTLVYTIPVGIADVKPDVNNVRVIPNPFTKEAMLAFDNRNNEEYRLSIFNIAGEKVMEQVVSSGLVTLKRDQLNSGLYLYELKQVSGGNVLHGKFVIE